MDQQHQQQQKQRGCGGGIIDNAQGKDHLVQERMSMCVGICILLAVVYVLPCNGDQEALMDTRSTMSVLLMDQMLLCLPT
jgi:hypothetical protein